MPTPPTTPTLAQIVEFLMLAGLSPRMSVRPFAQKLELRFDGEGADAPYGHLYIGAKTGRILRGEVRTSADAPLRRFATAPDALAAIRETALRAGVVVRYHGTRAEDHGLYVVRGIVQDGFYAGRLVLASLDNPEYEVTISAGNRTVTPTGEFRPCGHERTPETPTSTEGCQIPGCPQQSRELD